MSVQSNGHGNAQAQGIVPLPTPVTVRAAPAPTDVPADDRALLAACGGTTVLHRRGRDGARARVVAGLIHGNEPSGFRAIAAALRDPQPPETDVWFVLGAIEAASLEPAFSHRMPPGRRDLNRCFRAPFDGPDGAAASAVLAATMAVRPEAVVDLHNNTGHNPAYAIASRLDPGRLQLATLFAHRIVESHLQLGTFMEAFDATTVITVECGRAGDPRADAVATSGLRRFLQLEVIDHAFVSPQPVAVLVDPVRVCLRAGVSLAYANRPSAGVDLTLDADVDRHNFQTLSQGTRIGWVTSDAALPIVAVDSKGTDVADELFEVRSGELVARTSFVPIMMTTDPAAARDDCLFYAAHQRQ